MLELDSKKKELVRLFLDRDVLISSDFIDKINDENVDKIFDFVSKNLSNSSAVVVTEFVSRLESTNSFDFANLDKNQVLFEKEKTSFEQTVEQKPIEVIGDSCVKIICSYDDCAKKRTVEDFVGYFNARFSSLEKILRQRQELQGVTSISRILAKKDRDNVCFIGMVVSKDKTKNEHYILTLEDKTGRIKILVSKNKPDVYELVSDVVLDEVIGVVGVTGKDIVFVSNILFPEIPLTRSLKKAPDEAYAVFVGDFHFGSKSFMQDSFERFLSWINGDVGNDIQKELASKICYLFVVGDLVEGVGIYPNQDRDLAVKDINAQYDLFSDFVKKIPQRIKIIVCPGNHDAMRLSEPQPAVYKDFVQSIYSLPNIVFVSSPSFLNIHYSADFEGFDVLMYHGFSFPFYADHVESIRSNGGQKRADLIMQFLLQRRHLAPSHTSTLYIPDPAKDHLVISQVPDFFVTGHIHRVTVNNYKNITLLNCSSWLSETDYQQKVGLVPEPARAIIVNLQTRDAKVLRF